MKKLKLAEIRIDAGTQTRAVLNEDTIADYAEAMTEGAKFPPVVVFTDGCRDGQAVESVSYLLADGFHRLRAADRCGWKEIEADIRKGTLLDALRYSLGANTVHGLRRSNADKRRCVEIALREFAKLSDRALAAMCGVSNNFVGEVRKDQLSSDDSSNSQTPAKTNISEPPATRTGRDGKQRPATQPPRDHGPPPVQEKDPNGKLIPSKLLPLWRRRQEIQDQVTQISKIRSELERGNEEKDLLYAELSYQQAHAALSTAYTAIKATMPYCVCPSCQGEGCRACGGRGLIGKFRYDTCIPRELKE
jgi:uncharacterized ParB-like nuclease family protein